MPRQCANETECGSPASARSKYCSPQCRDRRKYLTKKQDGRYDLDKARNRSEYQPTPRQPTTPSPCTVDHCERANHSRGMCKMHYKRWARANGLETPTKWDDRRKDRHHQRRAAKRGRTDSEPVSINAIIRRDGTDCSLCGQPVDLALTWPHRMYKSIDHTIPLARGGRHAMDNTTLAHFACNASKGDREWVPAA